MNKLNILKYDWKKIQELYDSGISLNKLNVSRAAIINAIDLGFFIKNDRKFKHTEETKYVLSLKLKNAHINNIHSGWAHINSRKDKRSYPERFFLNVLKNNTLWNNYQIEEKFSIGKYFLDFAFINIKVDLEIDGEQHYKYQENINHDKKRDQYLIDKGWKIYRICWKTFIKNKKEEINKFLKFIENIENETSVYYSISDIKFIKIPIYGTMEDYNKIREKKSIELNKERIQNILQSNINFSKFGWVNKVANINKMKSQKINTWMKKWMFDFYNDKCFKSNRCHKK